MLEAIYCIRMWLFQDQFVAFLIQLPSFSCSASGTFKLLSRLRNFSVFLMKCCVWAWIAARDAAITLTNSLDLLQQLQYVNKVTFKKMLEHLWYLSKVIVSLGLFDPAVDVNRKRLTVADMNAVSGLEEPVHRFWMAKPQGKPSQLPFIKDKGTVQSV